MEKPLPQEVVMSRFSFVLPALVSLTAATLSAAPKIEIDPHTYQCGTVMQGKVEKITAKFSIKNIGDAPLKLTARPGCGCTLVKYDSLLAPGKSSFLESEIAIGRFNAGPLSKHVSVTSNAENSPTVQLTIEATLQAIIEMSENYLALKSGETSHTMYLSSKKKDLSVSDVTFKADGADSPEFKNVPVSINYNFTPLDSTRSDGYKVYKMVLVAPKDVRQNSGNFTITTNHPDKKELVVSGGLSR
jgi:hypothetical protein